MKTQKRLMQRWAILGAGAFAMLALTTPSWGQPSGGGRGTGGRGQEGRGRFGGPGGMGARRDSAKFKITRWVDGVQQLDSNSKTALTQAQAKQLVKLLSPWRSKKTMSDQEAATLYTRLNAVLTSAQKAKIERFGPGGGFGGPRGGPDGGPGGFGGPPGDGPDGGFGGFGGPRGGRGNDGRGGGGRGGDGPPDFGPPGGDFGGRGGPGGGPRGGGGPDGPGGFDGPPGGEFGGRGGPGGGFGGGPGGFDGERPSESEMRARRATMESFMKSNNPFASPKSNPQFAKMPERMRTRQLERYKEQDEFFSRLKKKAK